MSKARHDPDNAAVGGAGVRPPAMPRWLAGAALALMAMLVALAYGSWQETRAIRRTLDDRLDKLDTRLADLAKATPAAAPARRGPDPDRVYSVKTDGAPAQGPAGAPVTIVELSDFQ